MILPKLKIVKSGKEMDSTDPRDFIINTDYDSVIVYMTELREVVVGAGATVKDTVYFKDINMENNYEFDFFPIVKISAELNPGSGKFFTSPFSFVSGDGNDIYIVQDNEDDTGVMKDKFFVSFHNSTGSQKTVKYRYRVFANIG